MKTIDFGVKRIADPVHGSIGLSALEIEIINTSAFQRLRNIKHLGLAHLVFPGADFSRFAHSLGVCHVTGMILSSLRNHAKGKLKDENIQTYRLAGLLHDIGHYPFSHAMEDAVENYYKGQLLSTGTIEYLNHEEVSKEILLHDKEIKEILDRYGIDPRSIYSIFNREPVTRKGKTAEFANLVSSDLDADRIDYMLRTAHNSGLPYGQVDLTYLLSQLRVDKDNRICLTSKAMRTAEHFLLCRYFDYQQVAFHKTVAGLEWVLKDLLAKLLETGIIACDSKWVNGAIQAGEWNTFDDAMVTNKIRELNATTDSKVVKIMCASVLKRKHQS
jgi:HD superfamily phosphohydrolase